MSERTNIWSISVYRKLCAIDTSAHLEGHPGMSRFEQLSGPAEDMLKMFDEFCKSDQALCVELRNDLGNVVKRRDLLVELTASILRVNEYNCWNVIDAVVDYPVIKGPLPAGETRKMRHMPEPRSWL